MSLAEHQAALACTLYARPTADGQDCLAWLYGLRGASSLHPFHAGETNDVRELARRDYAAEYGDGWEAEWRRRIEESFTLLEGRMGDDWPDHFRKCRLSEAIGAGDHQ